MRVSELIEKLRQLDPMTKVAFAGEEEADSWSVGELIENDDSSWVLITRGTHVPVTVD